MMNKQLVIIGILLFGFVCISSTPSKVTTTHKLVKTNKVKVTPITPHLSPEQRNDYVRRVFEQGDTAAYLELWKEPVPFLLCAMVMANKYNYPEAFLDVYDRIISPYRGLNNIPIDTATFNLAYSYLKRGVELGSKPAKFSMSMLLLKGVFVQQDTVLAKKLYFESDMAVGIDSVKLEKYWQRMMKDYSGYRYRTDLNMIDKF